MPIPEPAPVTTHVISEIPATCKPEPEAEHDEDEHIGTVVHSLNETSEPIRFDTPTIKHDEPAAPSVKVYENPFKNNSEDDSFEISNIHTLGTVAQHEVAEVETLVIKEPKEKPYDPKEELKRNRLRALSLNFKTQKGLEELERQPAYMRRDMDYEEIVSEEEVSQYSASSQGISSENSFLHKGVEC